MAKSVKKSDLPKYLGFGAIVLGIIAIIMLFLPALKIGDDTTYSGFQLVFGYTEKTELLGSTIETKVLGFSFVALLGLLLLVGGALLGFKALNGKKANFALLATLLFVGAAVIFFLANKVCVVWYDKTSSIAEALKAGAQAIKDEMQLGVGAVLTGIFAALAGVSSIGRWLTK